MDVEENQKSHLMGENASPAAETAEKCQKPARLLLLLQEKIMKNNRHKPHILEETGQSNGRAAGRARCVPNDGVERFRPWQDKSLKNRANAMDRTRLLGKRR